MLTRFFPCLLIWVVICGVTAIPSWLVSVGYSVEGRAIGIAFWAIVYATITSTDAYMRAWRLPYVRQAIIITYTTRMLISLPALIHPIFGIIDIFRGKISIDIGESLYRTFLRSSESPQGVTCTTIITIIHGGQLSILIFLVLLVVLPICEARFLRKMKYAPREFEVLPVDPQPVSLKPGKASTSQSATDQT